MGTAISATILSLFSTTTTTTKIRLLRSVSKIPIKYKSQAIQQAQEAITDYLHSTRSLPFLYAENIVKNATLSLSSIISQIPFRHSTFLNSIHKFLRYHPINEFEFFYESIGIDYKEIKPRLAVNKFFLSEDTRVFSTACDLADFGFPWDKLGRLYNENVDIFCNGDRGLLTKLSEFKDRYGFSNALVAGICLAFPQVLSGFSGSEELLGDMKRVLLDTELGNYVKGNVNVSYMVCRKIKLFYELGCEGEIGELLAMNYQIFTDYAEDDLVRKIDFFCRLGVDKEQVGLLLLVKPDILKFDLEDGVISVLRFLKHFRLSRNNLKHIEQNYPYVLGRNKMVNVPHILRAINLSEWFFYMIKFGDHSLLATYGSSNQDEDVDDDYRNNLQKLLSGRYHAHCTSKLDFLHGIGFGENKFTLEVLPKLHGCGSQLYERFNLLLSHGIQFSRLCKMVRLTPPMLNQNIHVMERKLKFLIKGMDSSLEYLGHFPAYLMYDLESRIKPRFRFHMWLRAQGYCNINYSVSTMIALSDKAFIARMSEVHPDAPKKWLEFETKKRKPVAEKSQSS